MTKIHWKIWRNPTERIRMFGCWIHLMQRGGIGAVCRLSVSVGGRTDISALVSTEKRPPDIRSVRKRDGLLLGLG